MSAPWSEEVCKLPGGLVLDDGRRLSTTRLRPLNGHEEDWLAWHADMPSAVVVTQLLTSCVVDIDGQRPDSELFRDLLVADRDYLILQLRHLTIGDRIDAVLVCPGCGSKVDVDFKLADIPVQSRHQEVRVYDLELEATTDSEPARTVRFRLPTGADQEALFGLAEEQAVEVLFERCLIHDRGTALTEEQKAEVISTMEKLAPELELELDLTCPECEHDFTAPFDTTAFFFEEMRTRGRRLLQEVHLLALYYHWTEDEILRLTRARRRAYLALLNEWMAPA